MYHNLIFYRITAAIIMQMDEDGEHIVQVDEFGDPIIHQDEVNLYQVPVRRNHEAELFEVPSYLVNLSCREIDSTDII